MHYVRTITSDNGTGFQQFKKIENETRTKSYFCTPYHSWQRGTNENTKGLIRHYFPKGKRMADVSQRYCDRVANKLNYTTRTLLALRTLEECYAAA